MPAYITGSVNLENTNYMGSSFAFVPVANGYADDAPMHVPDSGCQGTCLAAVDAPALLEVYCTSELRYINFSSPVPSEEWNEYSNSGNWPRDRVIFDLDVGIRVDQGRDLIEVNTTVPLRPSDDQSCATQVNRTVCYLASATGRYQVRVEDEDISLLDPQPKITAEANNGAITNHTISRYNLQNGNGQSTVDSTLAGIANIMSPKFWSTFWYVQRPDPEYLYPNLLGDANYYSLQIRATNPGWACLPDLFDDPRQMVYNELHQLMFRAGVHYGQNFEHLHLRVPSDRDMKFNQTMTSTSSNRIENFRTDFAYFEAAAVLEVLTILTIGFTFWGYWRLGRPMSLSPLEIGKVSSYLDLRILEGGEVRMADLRCRPSTLPYLEKLGQTAVPERCIDCLETVMFNTAFRATEASIAIPYQPRS
jgi:hypothetical protein